MGSYNVTYRQTYRPSDEAGPRGALASNNMGFLSDCTTNHKKKHEPLRPRRGGGIRPLAVEPLKKLLCVSSPKTKKNCFYWLEHLGI